MDVTKLKIDGEWLELETEHKEFGVLKVRVIPLQFNTLINIIHEDMAKHVMDVVIDWDLEAEGKKLVCDETNKNRYLPTLSLWKIKNPKYAKKGVMFENVGTEIIAFAQKIENFTKN